MNVWTSSTRYVVLCTLGHRVKIHINYAVQLYKYGISESRSIAYDLLWIHQLNQTLRNVLDVQCGITYDMYMRCLMLD